MKKSEQILCTTNYAMFKTLDGNRAVKEGHVSALQTSMSEAHLAVPIIVNEKYEVIDGQHRLESCARLKANVEYIVKPGWGLPEAQRLNINSKNWSLDDYMNSYKDDKNYSIYKDFKDMYGFAHRESIALLSGKADRETMAEKSFKQGKFKVVDLKGAEERAEKIVAVGDWYKGYKRRSFILAFNKVLNKKEFDFDVFLHKITLNELKDCATVDAYLEQIEKIYNYKNRLKVNLRF